MKIAIVGASGFLGKHLSDEILASTDWDVVSIARDLRKIKKQNTLSSRFHPRKGDVSDYHSIAPLFKDVDIVYYFVHMMGHKGIDFYEGEVKAAEIFKQAVDDQQVKRVIFVGGLGDNDPKQSKHLASRHRTGEILRSSSSTVIEFRASMIIGPGSVAYDIIKNIVEKLPIMILPKSAYTQTQPIALSDALSYLLAAATIPVNQTQIIEIGGPHALTYASVYRKYADHCQKRRLIVKIPILPAWLSGKFLDALTPRVHARIGRAMVDSMTSEMIIRDQTANDLFPDIHPISITAAFQAAESPR